MSPESLSTAGLSLASAASWGAGDFSGGLAVKKINVFKVVSVAHGIGFLSMLAIALLAREPVPPNVDLWWGAVAGVTGAFGIAALYRALAVGRMGIIAPVASVITGALPVVVAIRTDGLPKPVQLAGFALAMLSIWLLAKPDGSAGSHRGMGLAVLAGICFGLFLISGKQAGHHAIFWPMVFARLASALLMFGIVLFSPRTSERWHGSLRATVLSGLLDSAGNALFIAASQHGRLDVAAVLSSLYPASTVLLARFVLKEKITRLQGLGVAGALVSVALIASA